MSSELANVSAITKITDVFPDTPQGTQELIAALAEEQAEEKRIFEAAKPHSEMARVLKDELDRRARAMKEPPKQFPHPRFFCIDKAAKPKRELASGKSLETLYKTLESLGVPEIEIKEGVALVVPDPEWDYNLTKLKVLQKYPGVEDVINHYFPEPKKETFKWEITLRDDQTVAGN